MKVRIVEPVLSGYTGLLYQVSFTNGVSDRGLTEQEVSIIGAAMRVESLEGSQVGAGVDQLNASKMTMDKANKINQTDVDSAANRHAQESISKVAETAVKLRDALVQVAEIKPTKLYTIEELEAVADSSGENGGISGLRAIASKLGVKGRSINELIREILVAQGV